MKRLFLAVLSTLTLLRVDAADNFGKFFSDSTLRIDYVFAADASGPNIYLDKLIAQPGWYGRHSRLDQVPVEGNGRVMVIDAASGDTIYMHSFSSLFQEWLTTDEPATTGKAFENTYLVPLPRNNANIKVELFDNRRTKIAEATHAYRTDDVLVRRPASKPALPHKYMHKATTAGDAVDIAILAEGYTEAEMDTFYHYAQITADEILSYAPFSDYADRINIVAVASPSADSDVSRPLYGEWRDTAFGSHFSTFYSDRYLTTNNVQAVHDALQGIPYEHIIILANTDEYGGGGIYNSYTLTTTKNPHFRPVVVHEFGHSFGALADEYFYGDEGLLDGTYPTDIEPWEQNITTMVNFGSKWGDQLAEGTPVPTPVADKDKYAVGVYEGGGYKSKGIYRPADECRMRNNTYPTFCPVCQHAIASILDFYLAPADRSNMEVWYKQPAQEWVEALPVGNGSLGAMVYGGIDRELLRLNEETLWSGRPVDTNPNPDAYQYLDSTRQALFAGDHERANQLCRKMQGHYTESYLPLADLTLTFDIDATNVTDYSRSLNIADAVHTTRFNADGVEHVREVFVSHPERTLVMRIAADKPGEVGFTASVATQLHGNVEAQPSGLLLRGTAPVHVEPSYVDHPNPVIYERDGHKGMRFAMGMEIEPVGGTIEYGVDSLGGATVSVKGADEAIIRLAANTSFNGYDKDPYTEGVDELALVAATLDAARALGYDELCARHTDDFATYFDRVNFTLGTQGKAPADLDILERLIRYREGASDPALEELYYQFGRYLLISSSRADSQAAANLQGIWNHHLRAPWSSNYTTNINAQMNYWPAEQCNLSELHRPFLQQIKHMADNGTATARNFYHADGWALSHNSDIWAQTNPVGNLGDGDPMWANWYMGSPWVSQHLYDHYRFTADTTYLAQEAYPLMKGAAQFCLDWLIDDGEGHLVTAPSTSPENTYLAPDGSRHYISIASTMDMSLIRQLFDDVIEASAILDIDHGFAHTLEIARGRLYPMQIGHKGNLQEWWRDYEDVDPHHRHVSHLIALHPGHVIGAFTTPELAEACRNTLIGRGDDGTGWSLGWKINFWARLLDGDHSYKLLRNLLRVVGLKDPRYAKGGGSYASLLCAHPPFQIDGNFGGVAGMTEMLLQSQDGIAHLLPALPSAWSEGAVSGLRARGGYTIDMTWADGTLSGATITSDRGGECALRTDVPVEVAEAEYATEIETACGRDYYLTRFAALAAKPYQIEIKKR